MSSVTSLFVVVGDSDDGPAEDVAPKVADAIADVIRETTGKPDAIVSAPVVSLARDDWDSLQGGTKAAGGAVIWVGWNYARPAELEERLQELGFQHITVWSQYESNNLAPRVTSW
ncbi:hypothetical protein ABZ953_06940 [Streptomyces sp. NPDC046465]|uniref:hypothetical protein n=1 Tax=Streptomyces sp. NPDC046465 TaxID=3155810 RepID=UPI003406C950